MVQCTTKESFLVHTVHKLQDKRQALLNKFFTSYDKATLEDLLADSAQIVEHGPQSRKFNKSEWINLVVNHVVPAVPDYKWCHSTDATADKEGYCMVTVQVPFIIASFQL